MKRILQIAFLLVAACSGLEEKTEVKLAPPPEDKTGFTYIKPGGFAINYNKETVPAEKVDMGESDIVLGIELDGEARAYPVNFMTGPLNEVINDHLGSKNIAVTWCSVDYSGVVYHREFDGRPFHFGVMGMDNGAMVLYDRQTRSRWNQLAGKAVEGKMEGEKLKPLPSTLTTWKRWRDVHPETTVYVNRRVPYQPFFTATTFRDLATGSRDGKLASTDLVLALEGHIKARAYPVKRLINQPILNDTFEEVPLLVALSDDISTAKVYDRRVDGKTLTFKQTWLGKNLVDTETGTEWDVLTGSAIDGELEGQTLTPITAKYVLWFAWKGYRPDTAVYGES
ncbi:MAG: DUF3179 domain-containing (seleno)protein [Candidatus Latescibacterota bacterium]|nr:DUF3179 domain-containing (seleno)protein [Candidatus Latescibacterota bacterium]